MSYMDPACALISSMLPVMREKVALVLEEAVKNLIFMSSLLSQLMTFDENIRSRFNYDGGDPENGWGTVFRGPRRRTSRNGFKQRRTSHWSASR